MLDEYLTVLVSKSSGISSIIESERASAVVGDERKSQPAWQEKTLMDSFVPSDRRWNGKQIDPSCDEYNQIDDDC